MANPFDRSIDACDPLDPSSVAARAAVMLLGRVDRLIAHSKSGYRRAHPGRMIVFNANVISGRSGKIWFGDLDLTLDGPRLRALAATLFDSIYVLREFDGRFGKAQRPDLARAVAKFDPPN